MDAAPEAMFVVRNTFLEFRSVPHGERVRRNSDSAIVTSPAGGSFAAVACAGSLLEKDRSRMSISTAASTGSQSPKNSTSSIRSSREFGTCDRQLQAMDSVYEATSEMVAVPWWTSTQQPWANDTVVGECSSSMPVSSYTGLGEAPQHRQEAYEGAHTTVMLRNLPNGYTRAMLLDLLDAEGFSNLYDFVYLPIDFARGLCLGYAFINLTSACTADHFVQHFTGFSKWMLSSSKVCCVSWSSPHQGLAQHVERYRNSPVMHNTIPDAWKPLLFAFPSGTATRIAFPPPTKQIRPPNIRRRPEA